MDPSQMTEEELKPFERAFVAKRSQRHQAEAVVRAQALREEALRVKARYMSEAREELVKLGVVLTEEQYTLVQSVVLDQLVEYEAPWNHYNL